MSKGVEDSKGKQPLGDTEAFKGHCLHCFEEGYEQGGKAAVKHGYWIFDPDLISSLLCSECDFHFHWINAKRPKFCPNCGCKMDAKPGGDSLDGEKNK